MKKKPINSLPSYEESLPPYMRLEQLRHRVSGEPWFMRLPCAPGDFSLAILPVNPQPPLKLHSHTFEELVLITGGHGSHLTETEQLEIQAGDVFVVHANQRHGFTKVTDLALVNVIYAPGDLRLPTQDLAKIPSYQAMFCLEPVSRTPELTQAWLRLRPDELAVALAHVTLIQDELVQRQPGFEALATASFTQLIGYLTRRYAKRDLQPQIQLIGIAEVICFMESHYCEPLKVEQFTHLAKMSQSSLYSAFKISTGLPPLEYLIRLRIGRAHELLCHSTLAVKEIAQQVGFTDSNYFTRQYHRVTGSSPRATRKAHESRATPPRA